MDPEERGAAVIDPADGLDGEHAYEDEQPGSDEAARETDGGDDATSAYRAWLETDEGREIVNRRARQFEKQSLREVRRAMAGDGQANLQSDAARKIAAQHEQTVRAAQRAAIEEYQQGRSLAAELHELEQYDRAEFDRRMAQNPGWHDWYRGGAVDHFPDVFGKQRADVPARAEQRQPTTVSDPLDDALSDIAADPRWAQLTEADQEAVEAAADQHPDNPTRAIAAMNRAAGERFAALGGQRRARATQAEAGAQAARSLPPTSGGGGRAPGGNIQAQFRAARQNGTLTPELFQRYGEWRAKQGYG